MTRSKCYLSMFCVTYSLRILIEWWWRQSVRVKRMTMPVVHAELVMGYVDDKLIQNQQSYLSKIIHLTSITLRPRLRRNRKQKLSYFKKKHNQNIMIILTGIIYHAIRVNHDGQITKILRKINNQTCGQSSWSIFNFQIWPLEWHAIPILITHQDESIKRVLR